MTFYLADKELAAVGFAANHPKPVTIIARSEKPVVPNKRLASFDSTPKHLAGRLDVERFLKVRLNFRRGVLQEEPKLSAALLDPRRRLLCVRYRVERQKLLVL